MEPEAGQRRDAADPVGGLAGSEVAADTLDQARLRVTLNRYLLARAAARHPDADPDALPQAKADLVRLLQTTGWEPPASLLVGDDADRQEQRRRSA